MPLKKNFPIYLSLAFLCFVVYSSSLTGAWLSSDDLNLFRILPTIRYDPTLPTWLLMLGYKIGGFNPIPHHVISIFVHIVNTFLVFRFLMLFFDKKASLFGVFIFAVHPINTEAIMWISGRHHALTCFFVLLPYLFYHKVTTEKFRLLYYVFSLSLFTYWVYYDFGFYIVYPMFLLLTDWYFRRVKKNFKLWLPFLLIAFSRFFLDISLVTGRVIETTSIPLWQHLFRLNWKHWWVNWAYSFFNNLKLLVWPFSLTFYHEFLWLEILELYKQIIWFFCGWLIMIWVWAGYGGLDFLRKSVFAFGFFSLFLLPTFSPIPISSLISERYLYTPSIIFSMAVAFIYTRCIWWNKRKIFYVCFLIVAFAFAGKTFWRGFDYKNQVTFWQKTLEVSPLSYRGWNNLGSAFYRIGEKDKALEAWKICLFIKPYHTTVIKNIYLAMRSQGKRLNRIKIKQGSRDVEYFKRVLFFTYL